MGKAETKRVNESSCDCSPTACWTSIGPLKDRAPRLSIFTNRKRLVCHHRGDLLWYSTCAVRMETLSSASRPFGSAPWNLSVDLQQREVQAVGVKSWCRYLVHHRSARLWQVCACRLPQFLCPNTTRQPCPMDHSPFIFLQAS